MATVTYIEHNGTHHVIEVKPGQSLMEGAVKNNVPGIDAECGGACACATCLVYVDESWRAATGEPAPVEKSMLEFVAHPGIGSRLSCQIPVTEELDGLVVHLPVAQN